MFKKRRYIFIAGLLFYIILLGILTISESGAENSSIHGIGDAIWYSIVTLTTVGYGDAYPVTAGGRMVGTILVFCSLGFLSAVITGMVTAITGYTLPLYRLKRFSKYHWDIFFFDNEISRKMADGLREENRDTLIIYFQKGKRRYISIEGDSRTVQFRIQGSFTWLLSLHHGKDDICVFCFGDDGWENYRMGRKLIYNYRLPVYCLTEMKSDRRVPNLYLYDSVEGLGRNYWSRFPVRETEKTIIIAGCQDKGGSILGRGLQTNIFLPDRGLHYYIAGDSSAYRRMHYRICSEDPYPDQLTFCDSLWELDPDIIAQADRIIICHDEEDDNLSIYQKLVTHYVVRGEIHVNTSSKLQHHHTRTFGDPRDIYTPALVKQDKRNEIAMLMHELFRQSAVKKTTDWKGLTEFQKQSNIAAADHLSVKCRILLGDKNFGLQYARGGINQVLKEAYRVYQEESKDPEKRSLFRQTEHNRWVRFLKLYNWEYAPVYDGVGRKNPMLLPYEQLPEKARVKDDNAWELIDKFRQVHEVQE